MHANHDGPVADDSRPTCDDAATLNDMRLAAFGDGQAQLRLAKTARRLVLAEDADGILGSIEGVTYARLAAAQGIPDALMILAEHCVHLAFLYYETEVPEAEEAADMWTGQAIGVLELAAELLPASNAGELITSLTIASDCANARIIAEAKYYRELFSPAFGAAAFA
jgi:hypothetical protein